MPETQTPPLKNPNPSVQQPNNTQASAGSENSKKPNINEIKQRLLSISTNLSSVKLSIIPKPVIIAVSGFFILLIILMILSFVFRKRPTPAVVSTTPTPTPTPAADIDLNQIINPSAYADDPEVLKIEQDIKAFEEKTKLLNLREDELRIPIVDWKVNFNN